MKTNKLEHLAIILDGNGRWAKERKMPRVKGHYEGGKRVKEIAIAASLKGIKKLSVYAFSTENWKRPEEEVAFIFKLPRVFLDMYLSDLMKYQIKIEYIGDLSKIPQKARLSIEDSMNKTKDNSGMVLSFALNYGSQDEIIRATKQISQRVLDNEISVDEIDNDIFVENLMCQDDVDLLVRTSGEQRISNFLLWQIAYSEIYFTKTLWPDFDEEQLDIAIESYYKRDRRYGGIKK